MIAQTYIGSQARTFDEFASEIRNEVYRYALKLTRNPEDALDLQQDSLMKAYRALREKSEFPGIAWMYKIVYRTFLDSIRAARGRIQTQSLEDMRSGAGPLDIGYEDSNFAAFHSASDQALLFEEAVGELPDFYREVIQTVLRNDGCVVDAAHELRRTESTVRSQLRRAYQLIRRKVYGSLANRSGQAPRSASA